jgi:hypothetical protein
MTTCENNVILILVSSVADPDPNPYVIGPLGSAAGSISQRYGSEDPDPNQNGMDPPVPAIDFSSGTTPIPPLDEVVLDKVHDEGDGEKEGGDQGGPVYRHPHQLNNIQID